MPLSLGNLSKPHSERNDNSNAGSRPQRVLPTPPAQTQTHQGFWRPQTRTGPLMARSSATVPLANLLNISGSNKASGDVSRSLQEQKRSFELSSTRFQQIVQNSSPQKRQKINTPNSESNSQRNTVTLNHSMPSSTHTNPQIEINSLKPTPVLSNSSTSRLIHPLTSVSSGSLAQKRSQELKGQSRFTKNTNIIQHEQKQSTYTGPRSGPESVQEIQHSGTLLSFADPDNRPNIDNTHMDQPRHAISGASMVNLAHTNQKLASSKLTNSKPPPSAQLTNSLAAVPLKPAPRQVLGMHFNHHQRALNDNTIIRPTQNIPVTRALPSTESMRPGIRRNSSNKDSASASHNHQDRPRKHSRNGTLGFPHSSRPKSTIAPTGTTVKSNPKSRTSSSHPTENSRSLLESKTFDTFRSTKPSKPQKPSPSHLEDILPRMIAYSQSVIKGQDAGTRTSKAEKLPVSLDEVVSANTTYSEFNRTATSATFSRAQDSVVNNLTPSTPASQISLHSAFRPVNSSVNSRGDPTNRAGSRIQQRTQSQIQLLPQVRLFPQEHEPHTRTTAEDPKGHEIDKFIAQKSIYEANSRASSVGLHPSPHFVNEPKVYREIERTLSDDVKHTSKFDTNLVEPGAAQLEVKEVTLSHSRSCSNSHVELDIPRGDVTQRKLNPTHCTEDSQGKISSRGGINDTPKPLHSSTKESPDIRGTDHPATKVAAIPKSSSLTPSKEGFDAWSETQWRQFIDAIKAAIDQTNVSSDQFLKFLMVYSHSLDPEMRNMNVKELIKRITVFKSHRRHSDRRLR